MSIDSLPGRGTTVNVYLPRSKVSKPALSEEEIKAPRGEGELVLVVDDDQDVLATTVRRVEALGYATLEASSVTDATRTLRTVPEIQVVLTDIVLGNGESGLEIAASVRREYPRVSVILNTGHAAPAAGPPEAGADQVLNKPFTRLELAQALRKALRGS